LTVTIESHFVGCSPRITACHHHLLREPKSEFGSKTSGHKP
jgi:hypothetical protein